MSFIDNTIILPFRNCTHTCLASKCVGTPASSGPAPGPGQRVQSLSGVGRLWVLVNRGAPLRCSILISLDTLYTVLLSVLGMLNLVKVDVVLC